MMQQAHILKLMGVPVWAERAFMPVSEPPTKNFIFLAETEQDFTAEHQAQLHKILEYLGIQHYKLIYSGSAFETKDIGMIISFGVKYLPKLEVTPCITLSISEMLKNPPCKRQVLNDLKVLKATNA
jgi:hypothetical protein